MKPQFKTYQQLKSIVPGLKKGQRNLVRNYLSAFESNLTSNQENKSILLFNRIVKSPDLSVQKAMKLIESDREKSFDRFVSRLLGKVLDALNLPFHTQSNAYSAFFNAKFAGRNKMNQVAIVLGLGERDKALELLWEVVTLSEKYELFEQLVDAYQEWVWIQISMHERPDDQMQAKLSTYCKLRDELAFAKTTYYSYRNNVQYSANRRESMVAFYLSMQRIKTAFEDSGSTQIGYYFFQLMREYYEAVGDFVRCAETADQLVQLVDVDPCIVSGHLVGLSYAAKAEGQLNLLNFDHAATLLQHSSTFLKPQNTLLQVKEALATTYIYQGRTKEAKAIFEWLLTNPYHKLSDFFVERCSYGLAATEFLLGNYANCQRILPVQKAEIERDKAGWNFGQRLLAIMAAFERGDDELVYAHVAAAIKFVSRHRDQEVFRERDIVFFDLLKTATTDTFARSKVLANAPATVMVLDQSNDAMRWEPLTHELVHFESWLRHICSGKPYDFQLPEALYKRVNTKGEEFHLATGTNPSKLPR